MDINALQRLTEFMSDQHPAMDVTVLNNTDATQYEILSLNWDEESKKFFLIVEESE